MLKQFKSNFQIYHTVMFVPKQVILSLKPWRTEQVLDVALLIRNHHLPQNIVALIHARFHHVSNDFLYMWASAMNPGDRTFCNS